MNDFFKNRNTTITIIVVIGVIFLSGFYVGKNSKSDSEKITNLTNKYGTNGESDQVDFEAFWKAWSLIDEKFVPASTTAIDKNDTQARVYGAISGMVKSLGDPYTVFFPPVESKSFNEEISGQIEGVGMEVGVKDEILTVIAPIKGTPAYNAGIKAGDKILKVDETLTNTLNTEEAIKLIRGKKGTAVKLTLLRDEGEPFEVSVVRDVINLPTVDTEVKNGVFVIHLYSFSAISPNLFRDALRDFVESGRTKLIIDLRGNPGGYLEAAIDMASWFLPAGKVVVKEDFKDAEDTQIFRSKGYDIFNENLKMAILIDGGSASASEILAGALREHGVATLVGAQSFGKGSVQELMEITGDTSLKVTVARWLTPDGNSISDGGLTPDVVEEFDEEQFLNGVDNQLMKAIEVINAQ